MWRVFGNRKFGGGRLAQCLCVLVLPVLLNACQTGGQGGTQGTSTINRGPVTMTHSSEKKRFTANEHFSARDMEQAGFRSLREIDADGAMQSFMQSRRAVGDNIRNLTGIGMVWLQRGHPKEALPHLKKARDMIEPGLQDRQDQILVLQTLAAAQERAGHFSGALATLVMLRDLMNPPAGSQAQKDLLAQIDELQSKREIFRDHDPSSSIVPRSGRHAVGAWGGLGDRYKQALDRGMAALENGRAREAAGHFRHATEIGPGLFGGWLMLGTVLMRTELDRDALTALKKARHLAGQAGHEQAVAEAEGHIGYLHFRAKSYDLALQALKRSIRMMRGEDVTASLARNYYRLALVQHTQGAQQNAVAAARKSISLYHRLGMAGATVQAYSLIADILQARKDLDGAVNAYSRVLKYGDEQKYPVLFVAAHLGLGDILQVQGDLPRACGHWEMAARIARNRGELDYLVTDLARTWRDAGCGGKSGNPLNRSPSVIPGVREGAA